MNAAVDSSAPEPLALEIYSLPFRLRAPREEHDRLRRAAKHVDTVMRELVTAQPSADTTRLAIQAAFLIATDYFRTLDESFAEGGNSSQVAQRVDDILKGLEIALTGMKTALRPLPDEPLSPTAPSPMQEEPERLAVDADPPHGQPAPEQ